MDVYTNISVSEFNIAIIRPENIIPKNIRQKEKKSEFIDLSVEFIIKTSDKIQSDKSTYVYHFFKLNVIINDVPTS